MIPSAVSARPLEEKRRRIWLSDFEWTWRGLKVKKTGAFAPFNRSILTATFNWFVFYFAIEGLRACQAIGRVLRLKFGTPRVFFYPDQPRPWYLIWAVAGLAALRTSKDPRRADILFQFDDSTYCTAEPPAGIAPVVINARCLDVSKSRVAAAWEKASGQALMLDPRTHSGPMVEKGEGNGAHDGRVVTGPLAPREGRTYQRLVDNVNEDGLVEDLRCPTVGGVPVCVFVKERPTETRFDNDNLRVRLAWPKDLLSAEEIKQIQSFASEIGLDWGGVDVLRDRSDGRIYIVDANKTDMGPPTALPLRDKIAATRALSRALNVYLGQRRKIF